MIRFSSLVTALALVLAPGRRAQAPEVQIGLVPEFAAVAPGGRFRVAVQLRIPDGWHIAWTNPGQSGLPTTLAWHTSSGISAGEMEWPYPERTDADGFVSHIYRGVVVVVTSFSANSVARGGVAALRGELSWGLCAAVCLPQRRTVEVALPIRTGPPQPSTVWRTVEPALDDLPARGDALTVHAETRDGSVRVLITGLHDAPGAKAQLTFFPVQQGRPAVAVPVEAVAGGIAVILPKDVVGSGASRVVGVLVAKRSWIAGANSRALLIDVPVSAADP